MARERLIRWTPWEGPGLEHARVVFPDRGGMRVRSVVSGEIDGVPFGLGYRLLLNSDWTVGSFRIDPLDSKRAVDLSRRRREWRDETAAQDRPDLAACLDVDLLATPMTNTLPIRRLRLAPGESQTVTVAYFEPPEFAPKPMSQRYTRLDQRLYRFEALGAGFTADLPIDEDGFVLDYPGLFRRID